MFVVAVFYLAAFNVSDGSQVWSFHSPFTHYACVLLSMIEALPSEQCPILRTHIRPLKQACDLEGGCDGNTDEADDFHPMIRLVQVRPHVRVCFANAIYLLCPVLGQHARVRRICHGNA